MVLSPPFTTTLALGAITVAGYAISAIWDGMSEDVRDVDDVLKDHAKLIRDIKDAYEDAMKGLDAYAAASARLTLGVRSRAGLAENQFMMRSTAESMADQFKGLIAPNPNAIAIPGLTKLPELLGLSQGSEFAGFNKAIDEFFTGLRSGKGDVDRLVASIVQIADADQANVELQKTAFSLLSLIEPLRQLQDQAKALREYQQFTSPEAVDRRRSEAYREYYNSRTSTAAEQAEFMQRSGLDAIPVPTPNPARSVTGVDLTEAAVQGMGVSSIPVPGRNPARDLSSDYGMAAQEALRNLEFEREQLSRTSAEQRVYNELKAAGVSAESEFGQQIRASVVELEAAREAQKQIVAGMDDMRSATSSVISGLVQGQDVTKMLAGRLANFGADKLTDALLGPSGKAGGGIFGDAMASLLGGGKPMSVATAQITAATVVVNGGVGSNVPSAVAGLAANGNAPGGSSTEIAANLLREREGYRSTPYWDVNAYRVGYGSDTTTDPATGAVSRVTPGMSIDRMMAEADLSRRIAETQTGIRGQVGAGAWDALNPGTQGALTSVGYNYGSLPQRVIPAAQSGDQNAIATAIEGLSGDNGGVNASRRMLEAQMVRESQALAGFGQNVTAATGSVGQFGDGLSSVAQSVMSVPATGGSTATGGGLFGWLGGLFGGGNAPMVLGGDRANGGPVNAGEAYVVGERRAELFVPQRSGSIMPSVPGGGSVINFIDQSGNGTRQETKKSRGPNGEEVIDVYVRDKIASETREGGSIDKAFTSRGVSQPLRRRA